MKLTAYSFGDPTRSEAMKDLSKPGTGGPIKGKVVGQFFGIFNGIPADRYQHIVNTAPFDKCNLLILAFVRTVKSNGVFTLISPIFATTSGPRPRATWIRIASCRWLRGHAP